MAPNNDTLYSSAWYDLRHGDLIINVPAMDHPQRYWNVMIRGYTRNVCAVGIMGQRRSGTGNLGSYETARNDDSKVVTVGPQPPG